MEQVTEKDILNKHASKYFSTPITDPTDNLCLSYKEIIPAMQEFTDIKTKEIFAENQLLKSGVNQYAMQQINRVNDKNRELTADVERLKKLYEISDNKVAILNTEISEKSDRIESLEKALARYGVHDAHCAKRISGNDCDCGLKQTIKTK